MNKAFSYFGAAVLLAALASSFTLAIAEAKEPETIETVRYIPKIVTETVTVTETKYVCVYEPEKPEKTAEYEPKTEDVEAIAKTLWGECRGVPRKDEQAAVAWCILNRLDAGYAETVLGVCSAPGQFTGYSESNPVTDELSELAADVLTRHHREQEGETDVGRTLPADYFWFFGSGGRNWFRNDFTSSEHWAWELPSPYEL